MYKHFFKSLIDSVLSICGLVMFCVPMLIIAIAIKIDSKGPIFFKQVRLGKDMKPITVYKFRTMCDHAYEIGGIAASASDTRITKVGAFLRRTSLDELPQMFNIINGTMAIIGPRPILDWEFESYRRNAFYCKRYDVKAGMFCTVDIKYRASADRNLQFKMDAEYAEEISLSKDIHTFFAIFVPVLTGKGVYKRE